MVYCVGLTGNIASGKSTVAALFAKQGILVISADDHAKRLTCKGQPALQAIANHFGDNILTIKGELNRKKLRERIFLNESERIWLEQLLHPLIRQGIEQEINQCLSAYCIIEIPLLLDRSPYPYLNRVLVVIAPKEQQLIRVMQRDHCSRAQAEAILAAQPSEKARIQIADDLINNDSDLETLERQVLTLHQQYLLDKLT